MKFDYIIGNPPYQKESVGDQKTFASPVYHIFLNEVYKLADKVELIHPARFLSYAGRTGEKWNKKILEDPNFKVLYYEHEASKLFPESEIKGGVVITYHDTTRNFGSIGVFTQFNEMNSIIYKVSNNDKFVEFSSIILSRTVYRLTKKLHENHPEAISQLSDGHAYDMSTNIFERLPQVFYDEMPIDDNQYVQILGRLENERVYKFIRKDYVNNVANLYKYKIYLAKANGKGELGESLTPPVLAEPGIGATETFISIGAFDTKEEAEAVIKYIRCKFSRLLLGVLKITQDITPKKWKYVPLQDFTSNSDIDWSKSIPEIDQQLYKKYGLDDQEIEFIESHVKPME